MGVQTSGIFVIWYLCVVVQASGDEGSEHLAVEGDPRRYVDVMGEFEVLGEAESVWCR